MMSKTLTHEGASVQVNLLEEHLRAENAHDLDAIMKTFAEDARLILNGYTFGGHDVIRALHHDLGFGGDGGFSELRVEERHRYVTSEAVIIEQTLSGRHTGTWQGIEASGITFKIAVCTIYTFDEEGRIVGENVYFDRALLLEQLGALP
ncbi:MAG TPA: ester cyclase [Pyrinomonadaceae bacterium]